MSDTKKVLLPSTSYDSFYKNPKEQDKEVYSNWNSEYIMNYKNKFANRKRYIVLDGPPYANGHIHVGHALNKVLKDVAARSANLFNGDNSLIRPGWDCHGLPIEWKVEELYRAEGIDVSKLSVFEFRNRCEEYAKYWVEEQKTQMKSLGVLADWENPYVTNSKEGDSSTVAMVHKTLMDNYLYRSERPILWSVAEQTALADAEVEYVQQKYQSLYVGFPVSYFDSGKDINSYSIVCWTSTPWSLPGNRAVAFNVDFTYGMYKSECGKKLIISTELVDNFVQVTGINLEEVDRLTGYELQNMKVFCKHPLSGFTNNVPVLPAEFVKEDTGTGFVHIAPALGPDDYYFGKNNNLNLDPVLNSDGTYNNSVPVFAGQSVLGMDGKWKEAQGNVISNLKDNNNCVHVKYDKHKTAISWRSKTPLLYRTTEQWFVKCDSLVKRSLDQINNITMYPKESKNRLISMMEGRPDWCISRQRRWGVPLGIFVHNLTREVLKNEQVNKNIQSMFKEHGSSCWFDDNLTHEFFENTDVDYNQYEKVLDVCDVWFESGAVWSWVNGSYKHAHLLIEGSDQHRGWFQSSLLENSMFVDGSPLTKSILTHGFVLDKDGKKMSKSAGNVIDPEDLLVKYGADVVRYWILTSDFKTDIKCSDQLVNICSKNVKKLRNTFKWLLGNSDYFEQSHVEYDDLFPIDKMILDKLSNLVKSVKENTLTFDYPSSVREVFDFCNNDLSAVWFTSVKDSLYCDAVDSLRRKSVVSTVNVILKTMTALVSPLFPIMAEQVRSYYHTYFEFDETSLYTNMTKDNTDHVYLYKLKNMIGIEMDSLQKSGEVKSAIDMEVTVKSSIPSSITQYGLDDLLGISKFNYVHDPLQSEAEILIVKMEGYKCSRCRKTHSRDTDLCFRCETV